MCGGGSASGDSRWQSRVGVVVYVAADQLGFEFLGMQNYSKWRFIMYVDFWLCRSVLQIVFCICKCVCNRVGLDKFFDLDLIGVRFRRNGL